MDEPERLAAPESGITDDPEILALLNFEPVPRKLNRRDGWTPDLQRRFIRLIVETGTPQCAAVAINKRLSGIEAVYRDDEKGDFRKAWDQAVALGRERQLDEVRAETEARLSGGVAVPAHRRATAMPAPIGKQRAPLQVVCDSCACAGIAGDENFAGIPDILAFDPVRGALPDRDWDEERQRAFIATLAVTGSVSLAAKAIGRHALGAERLRKARGGREFSEAWDAAIEIARDRELQRRSEELRRLDGADADERASWPFMGRDEMSHDGEDDPRERLVQKLLRLKARRDAERESSENSEGE